MTYKGAIPWNKGLTIADPRVAKYAKNSGKSRLGKTTWNKGKKTGPLSAEHRAKLAIAHTGIHMNERSGSWKETPTYGIVHYWLRQNYGKADECHEWGCPGTSKTFDWALIKGRRYERKRRNFIKMCRSCHVRYDRFRTV